MKKQNSSVPADDKKTRGLFSDRGIGQRHFLVMACLLLCGFFILAASRAAQAQTPVPGSGSPVTITVVPAFEGNFKYGEWVPVNVELENNGPDLDVDLKIPVQGSSGTIVYTAAVELPAGAKKRLPMYVLPNNYTRQLSLELYSGETLIGSQRFSVRPNPNVNFLVGLVTPERGALSLINTIEIPGVVRHKVLVDLSTADLPEKFEGLRSLDLLVINDSDTSKLSASQAQALETWVRQGGQLVIGGGAGAELTVAGLPGALFPGTIQDTHEVQTLEALEAFSDPERPVRVDGPFVVAGLETASGTTLAGSAEERLVHEWAVSQGTVDFIALDLAVSPFDAWNGATALWENLIAQRSAYPDWMPADITARQQFASNMPYALQNLPILDLPSARSLALMLFVYILLVGPVNYIVLQRLKRLQLAWITIPALTIFFSAASFGLGYALHGTDIFINKISILQLAPSGSAKYDSFVGIFSPAQSTYRVEIEGGGLVSPLSPYYEAWSSVAPPLNTISSRRVSVVQGDPALVEGLSVDQWSMQSFMSEGSIEDFGSLKSDLKLVDDRLEGSLSNQTNRDMLESFVVLGTKFVRLGPWAANETKEVSLNLSSLGSPALSASLSYSMFQQELNQGTASGNRRLWESRRSIVESIFERTPPYIKTGATNLGSSTAGQSPVFIGWIEEAPPQVRILENESAGQSSAVVVAPLSYTLPESGPISIPVGVIPGRLAKNPAEGGTCGTANTTGVYISRGDAFFDYRLPPEAKNLQPETLRLGLWTDGSMTTTPDAALYNWEKQDWTSLSGLQTGVNLVPSASNFIRSDGMIQVRLSAVNSQGCYYLGLGVEGTAGSGSEPQ